MQRQESGGGPGGLLATELLGGLKDQEISALAKRALQPSNSDADAFSA